jgi:transposase
MNEQARQHLQALEGMGPAGQWACEQIIALTVESLRLKEQLAAAQTSNRQLEERLEQLDRQAHRQAAPFRRPEAQRNTHPARAGRQAGHLGSFRARPEHIDQTVYVPLESCPQCGGALSQKRVLVQYLEEIPVVRPHVTQLSTEEGWCAHCQQEVYSSHPLQTGRAGGAAAVQLGPRALALACDLNKAKGLSMRKSAAILQEHFGLKITPGGLAQLVQRVGAKLQPDYEQLGLELRSSAVVHADETSWWVGGPGWWLWVFATPQRTLYVVVQSRAASVALGVLGENFAGVLVSDCLAIYDDLNALQQKCYSHHLKAVSEAVELSGSASHDYLLQLQALLRTALWLKALQRPVPEPRFALCVNTLKARAQVLLDRPRAQAIEEKVRMRLWKQRDHLFTFLERVEVPATNNLAERQLRPAVIARKISCGNKTQKGARAWVVLASLAATCRQNGRSAIQDISSRVRLQPARAP